MRKLLCSLALASTLACLSSPAHASGGNCVMQTVMCTGGGNTPSQPAPSSSGGDDYQTMAYNDAVVAGIDPFLFQKQINQESGWRVDAVSSAGAIGIAQIMPATAQVWNVDPWNAAASLSAAAQHMGEYQTRYGSFAKALACDNAGCGSLDKSMRSCADYYNCLPGETRAYISKIIG